MRLSTCFACLCAALIASATAFAPTAMLPSRTSWRAAAQTQLGPQEDPNRIQWSPEPTEAADDQRYGGPDLFRRASLGSDTCGYVSGYSSAPVTCVKQNAYCTNDGAGNMDCCTGDYKQCTSSMFSACLDYSASSVGACSSAGPRTICCPSDLPSCYTLIFSTTASPGKIFSILECQSSGGLDTLLDAPPGATTSAPSTVISSTPTATSASSSSTSTAGAGGGGDSAPVGAIVGGVVGGVAVLGLFAFGIFWVLVKRGKPSKQPGLPPSGGHLAVAQGNPLPAMPAQQYPQQQQQFGYPSNHSQGGYKPDYLVGAVPPLQHPQQHQQTPYGSQGGVYVANGRDQQHPTSVSPGTQASPYQQGYVDQPSGQVSPQGHYPSQHQSPVNELPLTYPVGTAQHRAEMS